MLYFRTFLYHKKGSDDRRDRKQPDDDEEYQQPTGAAHAGKVLVVLLGTGRCVAAVALDADLLGDLLEIEIIEEQGAKHTEHQPAVLHNGGGGTSAW